MSQVSNRHTVVPFVAGKTVAFTGQRLAKVGYKETKKNPAKFPSIAVSVPVIETVNDPEFSDALQHGRFDAIIREALQNAQDGIIRSMYESSDGELQSVSDDDLSIAQCLAFIEAESTGGRLTKEAIERWFDSELADNLAVMIADKLKFSDLTPENQAVIDKHVGVYKQVLSMLAGGKTFLADPQIRGCRVAIALASEDDDMSKKLVSRLDAMENSRKQVVELLDL
jgi:hypothetical protein